MLYRVHQVALSRFAKCDERSASLGILEHDEAILTGEKRWADSSRVLHVCDVLRGKCLDQSTTNDIKTGDAKVAKDISLT